MSYKTFTWVPRANPTGSSRFRVHSIQFGDGYKQSVGDGINNETRSWPLIFTGPENYIVPIRNFLREHQGFKPFYWQPPLEDKGLYEVAEFDVVPLGGLAYTLTATFTQRFEP